MKFSGLTLASSIKMKTLEFRNRASKTALWALSLVCQTSVAVSGFIPPDYLCKKHNLEVMNSQEHLRSLSAELGVTRNSIAQLRPQIDDRDQAAAKVRPSVEVELTTIHTIERFEGMTKLFMGLIEKMDVNDSQVRQLDEELRKRGTDPELSVHSLAVYIKNSGVVVDQNSELGEMLQLLESIDQLNENWKVHQQTILDDWESGKAPLIKAFEKIASDTLEDLNTEKLRTIARLNEFKSTLDPIEEERKNLNNNLQQLMSRAEQLSNIDIPAAQSDFDAKLEACIPERFKPHPSPTPSATSGGHGR